MIRVSTNSRFTTQEIIAKASRFFGNGGVGLDVTEAGSCCISFAGAGGYVTVTVYEKGAGVEVEVDAREFELQAKSFVGYL